MKNTQRIKTLLRPLVEQILREAAIDHDAVREAILYAENDSRLYNILHKTFVPSLQKFIDKGTFQESGAIKSLGNYFTLYVRPAYKKEFGDLRLNPEERKEFAKYFLKTLKEEEYLKF